MSRGYKTPASGMHKWTKDLAGKRYGRLKVESFSGYKGSPTRHAHWQCVCECGNTREVRATRLIKGLVRSCANCAKADAAKKGGKSRSLSGDIAAFRRLVGHYKQNASRRKIEFALDEDSLRSLFKGNCAYCGAEPSQVSETKSGESIYIYNGIDRLDSDAGYFSSNVVSCCAMCNYAKREMTVEDFLGWVSKVYRHTKEGNSNADLLRCKKQLEGQ